ncbi:hypothetical protein LJB86_01615, partial [Deltaproteobacteria bacterium OttesenSCG-928-M10]|nr:hypothetical protein [Deltaproteobacteria bacterium OttesenSCG-928-M10]
FLMRMMLKAVKQFPLLALTIFPPAGGIYLYRRGVLRGLNPPAGGHPGRQAGANGPFSVEKGE